MVFTFLMYVLFTTACLLASAIRRMQFLIKFVYLSFILRRNSQNLLMLGITCMKV